GEGLIRGLPEGGLDAFLSARSYRRMGDPSRFDLATRYLEPAGLGGATGKIEFVALARPVGDQACS
ncbi:MAG TPA: hypothetical protein VKA53_09300, partial [Thermoanaerobaculia bacterium]|nr:hypothetical protein [Thermoanaerobaculia bacterium]